MDRRRLPTVSDRSLFITWLPHNTRSASFAAEFGSECHFIATGAALGLLKYVPRSYRTLRLLFSRRPAVVLCINPPYVLGLVVYLYTLIFSARFILDSHTAAFDSRKWTWLEPLHRFLMRRAACSTVTNSQLAAQVEAAGGQTVVVSDIPYDLPEGHYPVDQDRFSIVFVCNYADDEPVLEVFGAASELPDVLFFVTGNTGKASLTTLDAKPENVTLTGFIDNDQYAGLLRSASAVLALTTRDFTMQRAGSEAVSAGTPLITSDWPVLHEIFSLGTVHVANNARAIRDGIREMTLNQERYQREILELRQIRLRRWNQAANELKQLLG